MRKFIENVIAMICTVKAASSTALTVCFYVSQCERQRSRQPVCSTPHQRTTPHQRIPDMFHKEVRKGNMSFSAYGASMLWERVILMLAEYIKNAGLFFICFVAALCLSIYGMPLNSLTVGVSDWAYATFRPLISTPYEADADPTSFFAFVIMLCVYASIMFVIVKLILRTKKS
ncbi:hypothetical protein O3S68_06145 [Kosakonia sp. SOY2]|uniref:hypothetical protein n=1 Tax=Kosakonia sp. SOY2 TaxID=3014557 RepID=UPI0022AC133D|nr:hypothetical protein [Kosakonia sp. SOY2]MCZ3381875.1 hypothetical protein [Kosakonia sp. SOY2]